MYLKVVCELVSQGIQLFESHFSFAVHLLDSDFLWVPSNRIKKDGVNPLVLFEAFVQIITDGKQELQTTKVQFDPFRLASK